MGTMRYTLWKKHLIRNKDSWEIVQESTMKSQLQNS